MLDHISKTIISAGPLILFGSFVFVFTNQVVTNEKVFEKIANDNRWEQRRIDWERKFQKIIKDIIPFLVISGVCFGLAYTWINQIWGLCTSLALMSSVGIILFFFAIRVPIMFLLQIRIKAQVSIIWKKQKYD